MDQPRVSLQANIFRIGCDVFGPVSMNDRRERALRFFEEAVELAQVAGLTREDLHMLVDWQFDERKPGDDVHQEMGGVGVTLYALAELYGQSLDYLIYKEIRRVADNKEKIRAKSAMKPKHVHSAAANEARCV